MQKLFLSITPAISYRGFYSILVWISSMAASAQQEPPYALGDVILPPSDYVEGKGHFEAAAINAQGYVAFSFRADHTNPNGRHNPLIYTGSSRPFISLTWPGGITVPPGKFPYIRDISDIAEDGSFWVTGFYFYEEAIFPPTRGLAWKVLTDGSSTLYSLGNLLHPINGGEEREGAGLSINSSGRAIGSSQFTSPAGTVSGITAATWNLPSPMAGRMANDALFISVAEDIDEAGNIIGTGAYNDRSYVGAFYNFQPFPTVSDRGITPEAINNGRIVGSYEFRDAGGLDGPFIYNVGGSLARLPRSPGPTGDFYNDAAYPGGDGGKFINASGDIVGLSANPLSVGNYHNPSFQVLWKRQPEGTYAVFTLQQLLDQTYRGAVSSREYFQNAELAGISGDGTVLLKNVFQGERSARLLMPVTATLPDWLLTNMLTGLDADPLGDPDRDGLSNLLEYALGLDPRVADPSPAVLGTDTAFFDPNMKFLTLTYTRPRGANQRRDIAYSVERLTTPSTDGVWTRFDQFSGELVTSGPGDLETVKVTSPYQFGEEGATGESLRLRVTFNL